MSETTTTGICSTKCQKTNLTTESDVELMLSLMADLLLCGYTEEGAAVSPGHCGEEGDVIALSYV